MERCHSAATAQARQRRHAKPAAGGTRAQPRPPPQEANAARNRETEQRSPTRDVVFCAVLQGVGDHRIGALHHIAVLLPAARRGGRLLWDCRAAARLALQRRQQRRRGACAAAWRCCSTAALPQGIEVCSSRLELPPAPVGLADGLRDRLLVGHIPQPCMCEETSKGHAQWTASGGMMHGRVIARVQGQSSAPVQPHHTGQRQARLHGQRHACTGKGRGLRRQGCRCVHARSRKHGPPSEAMSRRPPCSSASRTTPLTYGSADRPAAGRSAHRVWRGGHGGPNAGAGGGAGRMHACLQQGRRHTLAAMGITTHDRAKPKKRNKQRRRGRSGAPRSSSFKNLSPRPRHRFNP